MTRLFITATGTEVGKTLVTAALVHQLGAQGRSVTALKPVLSGFEPEGPSDAHEILAALGRQGKGPGHAAQGLDRISPWRFKAPLSPDIA
ncbi:MAG: ATP-dependent dethiobiotin synthetase BioD, partial [Alphaproteobacteria bacterium]